MSKPAFTSADLSRHTAAVCRREADVRRPRDHSFAATLDQWAANSEARAMASEIDGQPDLFASLQHQDRAA